MRVTLLGLISLLSYSYYKDGANFTVTHSTDDPETIGRAIIDHFNMIYGGSLLSYSGSTTDAVGQTVDVTFEDEKSIGACGKSGSLGYRLVVEGRRSGQYWLMDKPAGATHTFIIGKHVDSIKAKKDSEKVINDVQVRRSGGTATNYSEFIDQANTEQEARPRESSRRSFPIPN